MKFLVSILFVSLLSGSAFATGEAGSADEQSVADYNDETIFIDVEDSKEGMPSGYEEDGELYEDITCSGGYDCASDSLFNNSDTIVKDN